MPLAGSAINAAVGGTAKNSPAGPSRAEQMASIGMDFSGWTVSTGNSKAEGATTGITVPPWLMLGAAVLVAVVAVRWIAKR